MSTSPHAKSTSQDCQRCMSWLCQYSQSRNLRTSPIYWDVYPRTWQCCNIVDCCACYLNTVGQGNDFHNGEPPISFLRKLYLVFHGDVICYMWTPYCKVIRHTI